MWTRWLVLVAVLAGGCKKSSECSSVKGKVIAQLHADYKAVVATRDELAAAAKEAQAKLAQRYETQAKEREERFKRLEDSMGCTRSPADCCTRFPKLDNSQLVAVQSAAADATSTSDPEMPLPVMAALQPLRDARDKDVGFLSGPGNKESVQWCTRVRAVLEQTRGALPAAWQAAQAEDRELGEAAKGAAARLEHQEEAASLVHSWIAAAEGSAAVDVPAEMPGSGPERLDALDAAKRYQKACTK